MNNIDKRVSRLELTVFANSSLSISVKAVVYAALFVSLVSLVMSIMSILLWLYAK